MCIWPQKIAHSWQRCSPGRHHRTDVLQKEQLLPVAGRRHSPTTSVYSKGAESLVLSFSPLRCSPWVPLPLSRPRSLCPSALTAAFKYFVLQGFCKLRLLFLDLHRARSGYSMGFWLPCYLREIQCVWLQLGMMTDTAQATGKDLQCFGKWTSCSLSVRRQSLPEGHI